MMGYYFAQFWPISLYKYVLHEVRRKYVVNGATRGTGFKTHFTIHSHLLNVTMIVLNLRFNIVI